MTATADPAVSDVFPLRLDAPERVAALRDLLTRSQYEGVQICRRLGLKTIYDFRARPGGHPPAEPADSLDVLVRLFMDAERVDRRVVRALLPVADIETLEAVGLLTANSAEPGMCRSTALLYPTGPLYVTSDRTPAPDEPSRLGDTVYSAISDSTRLFLAGLSFAPCENFLELCAGTGVAALRAARHAGHAWAADISARATHFARFNALLNAVDNFTAVRGDLFEAVPDQTFDRICAHPPYMPALEQACLYRDGGPDGEQLTRRIVAGLPRSLREGGRFYGYCLASDRRDAPLEQRLRQMLGEAGGEFDVAVVALTGYQPAEYYAGLLGSKDVTASQAEGHLAVLEQLGVRQLISCSIVIQRTRHPRRVFTVRRQSGDTTGHREIEWLVHRETTMLERGSTQWLLDARPTASPHAHLHVAHRLGENGWTATDCSLQIAAPFLLTAKCPAWAAEFVARCDGVKSVREHREALEESGMIPGQASGEVFLALVGALLAGGFIRLEGDEPLPVPDDPASPA